MPSSVYEANAVETFVRQFLNAVIQPIALDLIALEIR